MESVRERLVASWNKAVASAVSTSQHPKPSGTLTSMLAIPVTPAVGKSWRITEKAPPPQPSKRASFFKGTLEQARLAGLTDEEIASETWGAARNMQLADDQTWESRAGTVIES